MKNVFAVVAILMMVLVCGGCTSLNGMFDGLDGANLPAAITDIRVVPTEGITLKPTGAGLIPSLAIRGEINASKLSGLPFDLTGDLPVWIVTEAEPTETLAPVATPDVNSVITLEDLD